MDPKENRPGVKYRGKNKRREEKGRDPRRREVTKRRTVWRKRRGVREGEQDVREGRRRRGREKK
jgi:hypothetical protein